MQPHTAFRITLAALLLFVLTTVKADDVVWDFEEGHDHAFTLWSARPAPPVPDDPETAGDEALTGKALPAAGVAWSIGRPDQFDGQKPAVTEGDKIKADGTMEYNQAGKNHPFTFPVNGRGQESYLTTYNLTQWGDNVHAAANDQIATSPMVILGDGAVLTVWAQGGGSGTHAPELESNPSEAYTSGSAGVAVRSAANGALLESVLTNGQGTLREDTIDLSAYAGQKVYIEVVDAFDGGWGWLAVDEIRITHSLDLGGLPPAQASDPIPGDGATDVPWDVRLAWRAGEFTPPVDGHRVYLSDSFDDVNDRAAAAERGSTSEPVFDTAALPFVPAFGETYYWCVDEVNTVSGWDRGEVWKFTVEPVSYPIPTEAVSASASSTDVQASAQNTANGIGLKADDTHSTNANDMWLSSATDPDPWIEYTFARIEKLDKVHIWNHNTQAEVVLGFGMKDVRIETSVDGETWTELRTVTLPQAPGKPGYAGFEESLDGVTAKAVRMTGLSNWSALGLAQRGLSEVRFFAIPMQAREPIPEMDASDVDPRVVLRWRAGRGSARHEVYVGSAPETLSQITTVDDPTATVSVDLGRAVYWRIDEVNTVAEPSVWEGPVWSFDTAAFVVVDDMESYASSDGSWIWETWRDGFEDNGNGALLGHNNGNDMERDIAYDGRQSLPFYFGTGGASLSEASRDVGRNWGEHGITSLSLMFYGAASNTPGTMFIKVNGQRIADYPTPVDLKLPQWQAWTIDLPASVRGQVDTLTLGFDGGNGLVLIDAVRLYAQAAKVVTPSAPDPAGLVAHYPLNGNTQDVSGNGHHGTAVGGPFYVDGPAGAGSALRFDGSGDQYVDLGDWNPSAATGQLTLSLWVWWNGTSGYWQGLLGKRDSWAENGMMWDLEAHRDTGVVRFGRNGSTVSSGLALTEMGEWEPWAVTADGTTCAIYRHGMIVASGPLSLGTKTDANLHLGCGEKEGVNPFNGALSEVTLYNRVLTPGEVAGLAGRTAPYFKPLN